VRSVDEDVSLARVSMDIQEHLEPLPLFWRLLRETIFQERTDVFDLSQPHLGFRVVVGEEATVHIFALSVASIVA